MELTEKQRYLIEHTFLDYQQTAEFIKNPVVMSRAEGLYYWDTSGKRYFDAIGGVFVASLGHIHPGVTEAIKKQLDVMTFAPPLHSISDRALELVETLGKVTPGNLKYIKPFSGGSESIESAIKFTRQYHKQTGRPGKYKFISFYMGYHGSTFGAMSASGTGRRKSAFEPLMSGFIKAFAPTHLRDRFDSWDQCNVFAADMVEEIVINEDPDTVAGVIIEPISNTGGIATPTEGFFRRLRETCDRYSMTLIFDEIITAFGKTGSMFGAQTFGVTPDIICGGKGLSSGTVPLGAMLAREDMADAFYGPDDLNPHFAHGHTYAANPLACAAGTAVIKEIEEKKLVDKVRKNAPYLFDRLNELKKYGVVREVRGRGTLLGVELVRNTRTNQPFPELGSALRETALDNGLIMRINPTWFAVSPALIAEKTDLDEMCALIEKSLKEAKERVEL